MTKKIKFYFNNLNDIQFAFQNAGIGNPQQIERMEIINIGYSEFLLIVELVSQ